MLTRHGTQQRHLLQTAGAVKLRFEHIADPVEVSHIGGEPHAGHLGLRPSEKGHPVAQAVAHSHVIGKSVCAACVGTRLHHEQDVHSDPTSASVANAAAIA